MSILTHIAVISKGNNDTHRNNSECNKSHILIETMFCLRDNLEQFAIALYWPDILFDFSAKL